MHLAQYNIARAKAAPDSPVMQEFVDNLELINGVAEASPGFIWRLQDESGDATSFQVFDDPLLLSNMSVWESPKALKDFLFKTGHLDFLKRRELWFEKLTEVSHVMWWVPEGHLPTLEEAKERLLHLGEHGDTPFAFGFRNIFPASENPGDEVS